MKKLTIIGASGHGKVIADIAIRNGYREIEFIDEDGVKKECAGFPVVGNSINIGNINNDIIVAIGNAKDRERIQDKFDVTTLIHPQASISRRVKLGEGSVVMAGAVVNSDTSIGKGCIINTGSSVDHDCLIGNYVHVSVGAHVAGNCEINDRVWIGAGAIISNNIRICEDCFIGAGAIVVQDILEKGTYVGCPAKKIK